MLGLRKLRSRAHQYVHRLMYRGLGLTLLHGSNVLLLLFLAGRFHPSHDQRELPLVGVDVQRPVAPARSSHPKKDKTSNKPSSPKDSTVHESDAYFTVKTYKGKSKESSSMTNVKIFLIKFKESILNKERLKRSYQASNFFT